MEKRNRKAGVLLHPTCLPGPYGTGALGENLHRFIDSAANSGMKIWQILPLGPISYGNSPYASYSTFAGNPLLICIDSLLKESWLEQKDITPFKVENETVINFDELTAWKIPTLKACYNRFVKNASKEEKAWFAEYRKSNNAWIEDYALFMAIKEDTEGKCWIEWPAAIRKREEKALAEKADELKDEIEFHCFMQFLFDRQWEGVHKHCEEVGIKIVGDVPIFVALDSSDVWTHQDLFFLDENCEPTVVAGVPPDYFCATGQLWGNPLYNWKEHKKDGYKWWLSRLEYTFKRVDIIRIDHFRGLEAYWEVPAEDDTAENGKWVAGPRDDFLKKVKEKFGELPLIAEDLGVITPEVDALRTKFKLPGMKVLQFAFGEGDPATATHAPHNHEWASVVYTGTHDNDTTYSWFHGSESIYDIRPAEAKEAEKVRCMSYMGIFEDFEINWKMIQLAMSSVADTAVVPFQDVLGLGSEARINRPGHVCKENWSWRMTEEQLNTFCNDDIRNRLKEIIWRYGRG
jgi:4-alpha-glucanotransferase